MTETTSPGAIDRITALQTRLAEVECERDQARGIAVNLEQQLAAVQAAVIAEGRAAQAHHRLMAKEHPGERVYYTSGAKVTEALDLLAEILDITWSGTLEDPSIDQARRIILDGADPASLPAATRPDPYDRLLDENKDLRTRIARHEDRLCNLVNGLREGRDEEREQAEKEQSPWRQGFAEGLASALEYTFKTTGARLHVHPAL